MFSGHIISLVCVPGSEAGDRGQAGSLFLFIYVPQLQGVLSEVEM